MTVGQTKYLEGVCLDKKTKEPVKFVNVVINKMTTGVMTDEKGRFHIKYNSEKDSVFFLSFDYLLKAESVKNIKNKIYLQPLTITLDTVTVKALSAKQILLKALDSVKKYHYTKDITYDIEAYAALTKEDSVLMLANVESLYKIGSFLGVKSLWEKNTLHYNCAIMTQNIQLLLYEWFALISRYDTFILHSKAVKRNIKNINDNKFALKIVLNDSSQEVGYIVSLKPEYFSTEDYVNTCVNTYVYIDTNYAITQIHDKMTAPEGLYDYSYYLPHKSEYIDVKLNIKDFNFVTKFNKSGNKYTLSNYFINMKYSLPSQDSIYYDERYMFNVKDYKIKPDEYNIKTEKSDLLDIFLRHSIKGDIPLTEEFAEQNKNNLHYMLQKEDIKFFLNKK